MADFLCWVTDWIGWLLVEFGVFMLDRVPGDDPDVFEHHISYKLGAAIYSAGCWFYGLASNSH